jgi:hypothetical protein
MSGGAGVRVAGSGLLRVRGGASVFAAGIVLFAIAACSSSQTSRSGPVTATRTGGPPSGSGGQGGLTGLRVIYHATFKNADPSAQTITFLSDGGKFRVTYDPPGYQDFAVSDGVKEVDSIQGELEYAPTIHPSFHVGTEGLPQVCAEPNRAGRVTVLGRTADRYTCKPPSPDELSEVTIDSDSGTLLAAKSETSTIAATSIDVNATIPAGSFDLPRVTTPPAPTEGLLNSKSPGVPDAQNAATAIEKCRADSHGALPPPIRTKGPKVILHCGAKTEAFAVTPGNSVDYQPHDGQYDITVTLPDGSMITYASSKCPGTPICINN